MKRFIICIMLMLLLGCVQACSANNQVAASEPVSELESQVGFETAVYILEAIKDRDYELLSQYAHPEKGVLFVPYSYIDYQKNLMFKPKQIKNFSQDEEVYIWGEIMSPDMIEMTIANYFDRFVYDKDYIFTEQIAINAIIGQGNSIENVEKVFENAIFVEFYDKGSVEYEGLDWSSLKIVMEKYNGEFKIVALIHASYTL